MKFATRATAFLTVCFLSANAFAQSGPVVAVVDVAKIFKEHPVFEARMEAVKKQVKDYEGIIAQRQKSLQDQKAKQSEYKTASPEYKRLDQTMAATIADIQVQNNLKAKEIRSMETQVYYETYQEVVAEVTKIAGAYGISLVINYDSTMADPDNRASVQRGVSNAVVFQRNLDLTTMVINNIKAAHPDIASRP